MTISDKDMALLRRLTEVPRWGIIPTIRQQNVADHSFHVIWIALWLCQFYQYGDDKEFKFQVMMYALLHDKRESVTGDWPSPYKSTIKHMLPAESEFIDVHPVVKKIVKVADCLEALLFLEEEKTMGNHRIHHVYTDLMGNFQRAWHEMDLATDCSLISASDILVQLMNAVPVNRHPGLDQIHDND